MKYCFVQDDDCHWYWIPVSERESFSNLLEDDNSDDVFCEQFEKYRFDGYPGHYQLDYQKLEEIK